MVQSGAQSGTKCYRVVRSGVEWYRVVQSGAEWYRVVQSGAEWYRGVQSGADVVLSLAGLDPPAWFVPLASLVPNLT